MSIPDISIIAVLALLLFGPDKLPGMMRQAGKVVREVQNTSQSFISEMERAADLQERPAPFTAPPMVDVTPEAAAPVEHVEEEIAESPVPPHVEPHPPEV
jgi:TatA/E family protein of Tat protein translocase